MNAIKRYPAAAAGVVQAVLALVIAFGANITPAEVAAVMGVVAAVLALIVHTQVTPSSTTAKVP